MAMVQSEHSEPDMNAQREMNTTTTNDTNISRCSKRLWRST